MRGRPFALRRMTRERLRQGAVLGALGVLAVQSQRHLLHRDAFGQVSGLVYVAAAVYGDVVGEQLQGDGGEDGGEGLGAVGDVDDFVAVLGDGGVALGSDGKDDAVARADFLDVGDDFFVGGAAGRDEDGGEFVGDEGDGAVFHFACAVAFGVDVADFLEFERAFEGGGQVVSATEEEGAVRVAKAFVGGALQDRSLVVEDVLNLSGDLLQFREQGGSFLRGLQTHCVQCHFPERDTGCAVCHQNIEHPSARRSPHALGVFPADCARCHPGAIPDQAPHFSNSTVRCTQCHN